MLIFLGLELRRGERALLDLDLFRKNRLFAAANFSALLNYTAYLQCPISFPFTFRILEASHLWLQV